jgi:predicted ATPase
MAAPAPLFGRDDDLREVVALLRSGTARLVTLTGPGGVGKTRLALEVAAAVGGEFPDGTAVVELAALQDVGLVLPTVARQLGLQPAGPDDLVGQLAAFLRDDRRLVVLDNVEHVLDAAPDVAALLARCAGLVVVATSRAPLRVRAEREHALGPLPVPEGSDADAVAASPAAQVLLDRARTVSPSFGRAAGAAPAVAAICRRLDGLPLALELAAAHARYLGPADLLGRLDQALGAARVRDLPARQQTMRATLDWSHDLLTADEQALLRRLAVFAGGFTLDAADAVASGGAEPIDAVAALGGLVEQSLVLSGGGAEPRYRLLEPVRQYAAARLAGSGETDAVRGRHADHVRSVAADARRGMRGPRRPPGSTGWRPSTATCGRPSARCWTGACGPTRRRRARPRRPRRPRSRRCGAAARRHLAVLGPARVRRGGHELGRAGAARRAGRRGARGRRSGAGGAAHGHR